MLINTYIINQIFQTIIKNIIKWGFMQKFEMCIHLPIFRIDIGYVWLSISQVFIYLKYSSPWFESFHKVTGGSKLTLLLINLTGSESYTLIVKQDWLIHAAHRWWRTNNLLHFINIVLPFYTQLLVICKF